MLYPKKYSDGLVNPAKTLERSIQECLDQFGDETLEKNIIVRGMFPQFWSDGKAVPKVCYTVVLENDLTGEICVIIDSEFAYKVVHTNTAYHFDLKSHCMIGKARYSGQYEMGV